MSDDLAEEVAKTINGISESDWKQLDPAVKLVLRRGADRLISVVRLIKTWDSYE